MNQSVLLFIFCNLFVTTKLSAQPPCTLKNDFSYNQTACLPFSLNFSTNAVGYNSIQWSFGDGNTASGSSTVNNNYAGSGNYVVRMITVYNACADTVLKNISVAVQNDNQIVTTNDTTICYGTSKQLRAIAGLNSCWSPATYLDNPNSPTPISSTLQNITYYYTAEIPGTNIIVNGNFNAGNTGFTSAYNFANPNTTEGEYFVGPSPQAWNPSLSNCQDHTTGNGNMMLVNGSPTPNVGVWRQTVTVVPNTNYAFSTWIQALWPPNPAQLQFSINGNDIGSLITASLPTCTWTQFFTTWNSGSNTTAMISIINKNTAIQGNDFALDDISFAPIILKRDSVKITVDKALLTVTNNVTICEGASIQLNATGSVSYSWSPTTGLNNPNIANPIATPGLTTQYIVVGTSAGGCQMGDTVVITINPKPVITKSADETICINNSTQLSASGGQTYSWSPAASLDNASIPNPIATPVVTTKYFATVTDANNCSNIDSITITVRSNNSFAINPSAAVCTGQPIQLNAFGGDMYLWQPAGTLNNPAIPNPITTPSSNTVYSVLIQDTLCGFSNTLSTTITAFPLPNIKANKTNDIDCTTPQSQLMASGAVQYSWAPANTLNNPNSGSTIAIPVTTTQYIVTGTDAAGCINYDSVIVKVSAENKGGYLMPTAFTPNNDGKNDCFGIKYWGVIQELEFSIYNRWGERIFFTRNPNDCWDGRYKGIPQDPAVFVYMIKAKTSCEPNVFRKGTFALIR